MDALSPELFDTLIIANIIVALALAGVRFYIDMRRPIGRSRSIQPVDASHDEETNH
ncbi:MAG: hypothetical protein KC615_15440 [Anaerolineae bacterium]|nr:hypothetical protein [Anaerolineae bacterium]MCA9894382.1 hypothetical protein [Anaerolineae bacterium]